MDLPSSSSDDSDYLPPSQGETSQKKRKRATSKHKGKRKKAKNVRSSKQKSKSGADCSPCWSTNIPNELLQNIFLYGVTSFGAVPFLCRCSQVCRKWNMVACLPVLWRVTDLSAMSSYSTAKDDVIKALTGRKLWTKVEHLNLTGWRKLTGSALEEIATNCPQLKSLNLARCYKLTSRAVASIAANCKHLLAINLSSITSEASNMPLKHLLELRGQQLNELCVAGNRSVGLLTFVTIQTWCGNLRILDISNTRIPSLNVEQFQAACPKLVELRMGQLNLLVTRRTENYIMEHSNGFPDLELLSLASITGGVGTNDVLLQRLLKTSTKLRQLDLRGCGKITEQGLLSLPIASLEQLFLSRCRISWGTFFTHIGRKWKHSLRNLDISWASHVDDIALGNLAEEIRPNSVLVSLNLAGCGVGQISISEILDSCSSLTELDLSSCRGIPRGFKQLHHQNGIARLREALNSDLNQAR